MTVSRITQSQDKTLLAHVSILLLMVAFGFFAPFLADIYRSGITGIQMVTLRIVGATVVFWLATPFCKRQMVPLKDLALIFIASFSGILFSQGGLVYGGSMTSPVNVSVECTSQPIFALLLSAVLLHQAITKKKAIGVALGCIGAVMLALSKNTSGEQNINHSIWGDVFVLGSQFFYAMYIVLFNGILKRYEVMTFNKWLFTFASLTLLPYTISDMMKINYCNISMSTYAEIGYIIFVCTFLTFIISTFAMKHIPPTTVSTYTYITPVVAIVISLAMGLSSFGVQQAVATTIIFIGVWIVTKTK